MLVQHSYDNRFVSLLERLRKTYGEEMFQTSGIGQDQLDVNSFSKNFFGTNDNTADKSIDSNANVNDKSVTGWMTEYSKPIMKLNAYYQLWETTLKKHGIKRANKIIETEIIGSIRIHDLWLWNKPYSYYRETPITVRVNGGASKIVSMKQLFDMYSDFVTVEPDRETIDLTSVYKTIDYSDDRILTGSNGRHPYKYGNPIKATIKEHHKIEVMDGDGSWTSLECVLRHKRETDMVALQTGNGKYTVVTTDHPVILDDGSEILASDVQIGDVIKSGIHSHSKTGHISVDSDLAYLIGFITGDGNVGRHQFNRNATLTDGDLCVNISKFESGITIYQKDIEDSKIYDVVSRLLDDDELLRKSVKSDGTRIAFSSPIMKLILAKYFGVDYTNSSYTKNLPVNILEWDESSKLHYISGLIDSDGYVGANGRCNIRIKAYSIMNSIVDILDTLSLNVTASGFVGDKFDGLLSVDFDLDERFVGISSKVDDVDSFIPTDSFKCHANRTFEVVKKDIFNPNDIQNAYNLDGAEWEYVYDITTGSHTFYSGGMTQHNCWAASLNPLIEQGMPFHPHPKTGEVKHFDSFINVSLQYVCYLSNQIAGAVALPNFFPYAEYFIRKDYGEEWLNDEKVVNKIQQAFQNWIYSVNFSWRSNQSPFTNLSVMDEKWLHALFDNHYNPDGSLPNFDNLMTVQKMFVDCVIENKKDNPFTFPVLTACLLFNEEESKFEDDVFADWVADINSETGIFNIFSDSNINALSSCCRLRNNLNMNKVDEDYTNSFGVGGLSIGSHRVVAVNLPQIAFETDSWDEFMKMLERRVSMSQDILDIHRETLTKLINNKFLPLYTHGFMDLNKQYSTIGFIGMNEALEIMGWDIRDEIGQAKGKEMLDLINKMNDKRTKIDGFMRNVEQIPGEGAGVTFAKKDALLFDGKQPYALYSNQYIPLIKNCEIHDRIKMQGSYDAEVGGGSILHINVESVISKDQMKELMVYCTDCGVKYWAVNYGLSQCKTCGKTYVGQYEKSPCHDAETDKFMRTVGFETPVATWSKERRAEFKERQFYSGVSL